MSLPCLTPALLKAKSHVSPQDQFTMKMFTENYPGGYEAREKQNTVHTAQAQTASRAEPNQDGREGDSTPKDPWKATSFHRSSPIGNSSATS